jgi:hypothetical protein
LGLLGLVFHGHQDLGAFTARNPLTLLVIGLVD